MPKQVDHLNNMAKIMARHLKKDKVLKELESNQNKMAKEDRVSPRYSISKESTMPTASLTSDLLRKTLEDKIKKNPG